MSWSLYSEIFLICIGAWFLATGLLRLLEIWSMNRVVRAGSEPEKEPCEWFDVESVEDLGRKIHAGIVLLNRQARSDKWDDRKKDAFIRASRHIEAAHYEVTRLVRN